MPFVYSTDELRGFQYVCNELNTKLVSIINILDICRESKLETPICEVRFHYCELLVSNVGVDFTCLSRIKDEICNFFDVVSSDVFLNRCKLVNDRIYSVKFLIRFDSVDEYLNFENVVLPYKWVILNRVYSLARTVCVSKVNDCWINRSELVNVVILNENRNSDPSVGGDVRQSQGQSGNRVGKVLGCSGVSSSISFLNAFRNNFNVAHVNCQGILESVHLETLISIQSKCACISAIAVSETWLRSHNTNKSVEIDGFKFIRSDRPGRRGDRNKGGGVGIYLSKNFRKYKIVLQSSKDAHGVVGIEFLAIEVYTKFSKVVLVVAYRAKCSAEDSRKFFDLISSTFLNERNVIITGDFNINFLKDKVNSNLMGNFTYNFQLINDDCPTHYSTQSNEPTQIDLFFTNVLDKVSSFGHFSSLISHHDVVAASFRFISDNRKKKVRISGRDYRNVDNVLLNEAVDELEWDFSSFSNVDMMVERLNSNIGSMLDSFLPVQSRVIRHTPQPWFNGQIKCALDERKVAYDKWRNYIVRTAVVDEVERELLREVKEEKDRVVKQLVRRSKKRNFAKRVAECGSSKEVWKVIKGQGVCKDSDSNNDDVLNNFNLNEINSYFASIHRSDGADLSELGVLYTNSKFSFSEVSVGVFFHAFNKIKSNAIGRDGIPLRFLKLIMNKISDSIIFIFNYCIEHSVYPVEWNKVLMRPVNKVSNPQSIADLRPTYIVSVIAKIFASILNDQVVTYLETESLVAERQSGFRPGYSCCTALLKISEEIRKAMSMDKVVISLFVDVKSAFPSVPHDGFIEECKAYGFDVKSCGLVRAMFRGITQQIMVGEEVSDVIDILNGILQGYNIGQTFFSMFINGILKVLEHLMGSLFADDLQGILAVSLRELERGISLVSSDAERINKFLVSRGLQMNYKKSDVMIIGSEANISKIDFNSIGRVQVSGVDLEYCKTKKNLGVTFDENFTFKAHDAAKVGKAYGVLSRIRHTRHTIPNYIKRDIVTALVDPVLDYGNVVTYGWGVHGTIGDESRILVADNDKIRYVYGLKRNEHITEYRERLNTLTPEVRAKIQSACLIYKQLNVKPIAYLNDVIVVESRRTRSNGQLRLISPNSTFHKRAFSYSAIKFWNSIPNVVRSSVSIDSFKKGLKGWIREMEAE